MSSAVMIKGNKYGVAIVMDQNANFETIKEDTALKFGNSAKFFKDACMAVSFEVKRLSDDEQRELVDIIQDNCDLKVMCVVDTSDVKEELYKKSIDEKIMKEELGDKLKEELSDPLKCIYYKGSLRSGQTFESENSIIVLGDVKPGALVSSKGNVIVIGSLLGSAYAGIGGRDNSFVIALEMNPLQISIAGNLACSSSEKSKHETETPQIAYLEDGNICIEPINKSVINDIRL